MRYIFEKREQFLKQFTPLFSKHYHSLSEGKEQVELGYQSDLHTAGFKEKFLANHKRDLDLQRTSLGIHKDDLKCLLESHPIRKFGSQGQQKSYVIALKLAQFELLCEEKGFKPILLLDDIFDKLDDGRIEKLIDMVSGKIFGQLFITDARPERTARILDKVTGDMNKYLVNNGSITETCAPER